MEQPIVIGMDEQKLLKSLRDAVRTSDLSAKDKNFYTAEIRRVLSEGHCGAIASVVGLARHLGHQELVAVLEKWLS